MISDSDVIECPVKSQNHPTVWGLISRISLPRAAMQSLLLLPSQAALPGVGFGHSSIFTLLSPSDQFPAAAPRPSFITKNSFFAPHVAFAAVPHLLPAFPLFLLVSLSSFPSVAQGWKLIQQECLLDSPVSFILFTAAPSLAVPAPGAVAAGRLKQGFRQVPTGKLDPNSHFLLDAGCRDPDNFLQRQQHLLISSSCLFLSRFRN